MKYLIILSILFLSCACGSEEHADSDISTQQKEDLKTFCKSYLIDRAQKYQLTLTDEDLVIDKMYENTGVWSRINKFFESAFQPEDSRIESTFSCEFSIKIGEKNHKGDLVILLIKEQAYAKHTLWTSIQDNPGELNNENGTVEYYLVVKYPKINNVPLWIAGNSKKLFTID